MNERLKALQTDLVELGVAPGRAAADTKQRKYLERTATTATFIQSVATVLALCIGGIWTWRLFDPLAEFNPNLSAIQSVSSFRYSDLAVQSLAVNMRARASFRQNILLMNCRS